MFELLIRMSYGNVENVTPSAFPMKCIKIRSDFHMWSRKTGTSAKGQDILR